jgi:predicted metal-dependent peptidase
VEGGPWIYEPWEEFQLPKKFTGGGGTEFAPVFDWVDKSDIQPDLLIYFTDAQGDIPDQQPPYPVVWLVKGKQAVPWGRRVQLN